MGVNNNFPEIRCPWCLCRGGVRLVLGLRARPMGTYSLAGAQMKFSVTEVPRLECRNCGKFKYGYIEGKDAVFNPGEPDGWDLIKDDQ